MDFKLAEELARSGASKLAVAELVDNNSNVVEIEGTSTCLEQRVADKILVMIDEYKTGYECQECNGAGKVKSGVVEGALRACPKCNGKGALLVVPETARSLPCTALVMSKGPDCKYVQIGDRVAIGPHTGNYLPIKNAFGGVNFKVLREHEILCHILKLNENEKFDPEIINYEQPDLS